METVLPVSDIRLVNSTMEELTKTTRILEMRQYIQHGSTSVFEHMLSVAYMSLRMSMFFRRKVNKTSMVRGALLHDYFLYDWHDKKARHKLHGFYHPGVALKNAQEYLNLNDIEKDVVLHHMFPLTFPAPVTKEGFYVSCADKIVSLYETFRMNEWKNAKPRKDWEEIVDFADRLSEERSV